MSVIKTTASIPGVMQTPHGGGGAGGVVDVDVDLDGDVDVDVHASREPGAEVEWGASGTGDWNLFLFDAMRKFTCIYI